MKPKRKPKQSPANKLSEQIKTLLELQGHPCYRVNVVGVWDNERKVYRKGNSTLGLPDLFTIIKGRFVGIEVKIGKDAQSEHQKIRQQEIEAAGGLYFIAKTFDQIYNDLKEYL